MKLFYNKCFVVIIAISFLAAEDSNVLSMIKSSSRLRLCGACLEIPVSNLLRDSLATAGSISWQYKVTADLGE